MIRTVLRNVGRLVILIVAVLIPLAVGFIWFTANLPPPTADPSETDAIVVLTGGSDRIRAGLALLAAGKGKRLFVSGVHLGVDVGELIKLDRPPAPESPLPADLAGRIDLGHVAGDTLGNAIETADWMHSNHFQTMRLVTADYHIRRAMIEFSIAAPDLRILPNPVQPAGAEASRWWHDRNVRDLLLTEYGKYVVAKWRYTLTRLARSA
jgi:uncharacterized SAM-binding protein YcdF (DUF218 family)